MFEYALNVSKFVDIPTYEHYVYVIGYLSANKNIYYTIRVYENMSNDWM